MIMNGSMFAVQPYETFITHDVFSLCFHIVQNMADHPLFSDTVHCLLMLVLTALPCILVILPVRFFTKIPSFVFRKLLHIIAFTGVSLMILFARSWQAAALTSLILAVVLYPLLAAIENRPWFPHLFVEKKPGEIKNSLLMLTFMFAVMIIICWGIFNEPHLAAAAILMWGTGDAAAALTGIPFGKHKVICPLTDGKKSWEGSSAMFIVSLLSGLVILLLVQKSVFPEALFLACLGSLAGTAVELVSPGEYDTVTVPAAIGAVLICLNLLV